MNKNKFLVFIFLVVALGVVINVEVFGQGKQQISTFRPSSKEDYHANAEAKLIEEWAEAKKKSSSFTKLYALKAAVLGDSYVCQAAFDSEECIDYMENVAEISDLAAGMCDNLLDKDDKTVCKALKTNSCDILSAKEERLACEGYRDLSFEKLKKTMGNDRLEQEFELSLLAFFSVFKNGGISSCNRLLKNQRYIYRVGCRILHSAEPQRIIDKLAVDFAYYYSSDVKKDKSICDNIKDDYLRRNCKKGIKYSIFKEKYF